MGKYLNMFRGGAKKVNKKVADWSKEKKVDNGFDYSSDNSNENDPNNFIDDDFIDDIDRFDDMSMQPSQKSESFHHFILENQYKDLERSIRGFKDVFDKITQQWKTIRKKTHCFTDEESEEILRTAQSHLATDIKLGWTNKEAFPILMDAIYQEIAFIFESIAEYRYGRYGAYEKQYEMKLQNHKIFLELFTRIQANYSRSIQGQENRLTHDSVKGQESLQQTEKDLNFERQRYS